MTTPRIQVLSITHPDMGTETLIFIDGAPLDQAKAEVESIDPGAGHSKSAYEERLADAQAKAAAPDATDFDRALAETLADYSDQFAKYA